MLVSSIDSMAEETLRSGKTVTLHSTPPAPTLQLVPAAALHGNRLSPMRRLPMQQQMSENAFCRCLRSNANRMTSCHWSSFHALLTKGTWTHHIHGHLGCWQGDLFALCLRRTAQEGSKVGPAMALLVPPFGLPHQVNTDLFFSLEAFPYEVGVALQGTALLACMAGLVTSWHELYCTWPMLKTTARFTEGVRCRSYAVHFLVP